MPSYSQVFSSQLIVYTDATPNRLFAVPSGWTAVVRQFTIWQEAGGALAQIHIYNSDADPGATVAQVTALGVPGFGSWEGRLVCPGGGTIELDLETLGSGVNAYIGGYLLRNTLT